MVPVNVRSTKDKRVVCSYDVPLVSVRKLLGTLLLMWYTLTAMDSFKSSEFSVTDVVHHDCHWLIQGFRILCYTLTAMGSFRASRYSLTDMVYPDCHGLIQGLVLTLSSLTLY